MTEPNEPGSGLHTDDVDDSDEPGGVVDAASVFYVVGGVPFMIVFFVGLFSLVGACDASNILLPF